MKKKYFTEEDRKEAKNKARRVSHDASLKEKFYSVDNATGCWEWRGCKDAGGYGYVRIKRKRIAAHRYMFTRLKSVIPEGLDLLHKCDNPSCVNPEHLFPGTVSDNLKDMYSKGRRSQRGIDNGNYKTGLWIKKDI